MTSRIIQLDALRGFAVILMVMQHLQSWLWEKNWVSYSLTFPENPIMLIINFSGNFAAPLFLILAGSGAVLLFEKPGIKKIEFLKRGLFIIASGYLLNLLAPGWFKPGSWYILHTIGTGIILAPLLIRLKIPYLLFASVSILAAAPFLQTLLNTPLGIGNNFMNDISRPAGIFRLIIAEGHFPLFPWLGFFVAGIVCCKWLLREKFKNIIITALVLFIAGIILAACYKYGFFFATGGTFFRFFVFTPSIYPPHPSLILMLLSVSLIIFLFFYRFLAGCHSVILKALNSTGRLSLTWFFIHIIFFNEVLPCLGIHKNLTAAETMLMSTGFILFILFVSVKWERLNYWMSMEWVMRRVI